MLKTKFTISKSYVSSVPARRFQQRMCPPIAHNDRRLGAAAADTKRSAGYCRSCSHYTFSGVTAAVAPNRTLCCCHH